MGVPSFFLWLINNFGIKNIIVPKLNKKANRLYIDANCAIHPKCFEILKKYQEEKLVDVDMMEEDMINNIINYFDFLIDNVSPTDIVYISVDGVAPMAKIQQQRKRRYKAPIEENLRNNIKQKHGITDTITWSNIVITPGTVFMEKLHNRIIKYINEKKNIKKLKYIYSSYHVPGEGEHKILSHIKKSIESDDIYVIYGLDADLIFLSFASQKNNIYLYRENNQLAEIFKNITPGLCYINIEKVKNEYYNTLTKMLNHGPGNEYNKQTIGTKLIMKNIINDFILLCFFAGNDFLPGVPSITITSSMNKIIECYITILERTHSYLVTNKFDINTIFFEELVELICQSEIKQIRYINKNTENKKKLFNNDPYKLDIMKLENMQTNITTDHVDIVTGDINHIKSRYYEYYFGINEYYNESVDILVNKYLEGIIWIIRYYFNQCPSWDWYYPYHVAPFLSDILVGIKNSNINNTQFKSSMPITPFKQLLIVIPKEYDYIIPKSLLETINKDSKDHIFIQNLILDTTNKTVFWKCVPYLPFIDHATVNEIYDNTKFSKEDSIRNRIDYTPYEI